MRVLPVTHTSSHGRIDLFQQRGPLSELLDIHAAVLRRPGKFRIRLLRHRGRGSASCLPEWGRSMVSLGRHAGTPEGPLLGESQHHLPE